MSRSVHREQHRTERIGWRRAAVLGANDGIVSTASLIVGEDLARQALIEQWMAFVRRPNVSGHAVFLSDYDMLMAERLVQGVASISGSTRRAGRRRRVAPAA